MTRISVSSPDAIMLTCGSDANYDGYTEGGIGSLIPNTFASIPGTTVASLYQLRSSGGLELYMNDYQMHTPTTMNFYDEGGTLLESTTGTWMFNLVGWLAAPASLNLMTNGRVLYVELV